MSGRVASIYRHPIKGFTPERLNAVALAPGKGFPCDRLWAVENGPSGFDPEAPAFVSKQKFTVLAAIPEVASAHTRYDDATGVLSVSAPGSPDLSVHLDEAEERAAFEAWLTTLLGNEVRGPLKLLRAPGEHRFTDHPQGQVSIINLASVHDLARKMGVGLDPLRFRANLYIDGWPAWAENGWIGASLGIGGVRAEIFKSITRCVATHVNPATAEVDRKIVNALQEHYGNTLCGFYIRVTAGGTVRVGEAASSQQAEVAA